MQYILARVRLTLIFSLLTFFSVDAFGQSFWAQPSDSFETSIDDIHVSDNGTVFVGLFLDGIFRSTDNAVSWQQVSDSDVEQFAEADGILYAAGLDGLLRSLDDGISWENIMPSDVWSVSVYENTIVAGGTGGQLYVSDNAGLSWSVANCQLMPEGYDDSIYPVVAGPGLLAYRHSFDRFFRSEDGGEFWSVDPSRTPSVLVLHDGIIYADDGSAIVSSVDGSAWSFFSETPFFSVEDMAFRGDDLVVASFSGVATSIDDGQNWSNVSEGLADEGRPQAVALGPDGHVYVALRYRVHRSSSPVEETGTSAGKSTQGFESALLTPFPNPFKARARIPFVVSSIDHVEIAAFDELGRKVDVLISRQLPVGRFEIDWTPKKLASGTYFIRMEIGGWIATTPILLTR